MLGRLAAETPGQMATRNVMALSLLACGLLAGCGATTPAVPTSPTSPASRGASYLAAGSAICAEQVAQLNRLPRPSTPEQTVAFLPPALAIMRHEVARLGALDPPGSGGVELAAALTSTRHLTTLLARLLHELRHGMVEFAALAKVQTQTAAMRAQVDARFRQAGLPRCAE